MALDPNRPAALAIDKHIIWAIYQFPGNPNCAILDNWHKQRNVSTDFYQTFSDVVMRDDYNQLIALNGIHEAVRWSDTLEDAERLQTIIAKALNVRDQPINDKVFKRIHKLLEEDAETLYPVPMIELFSWVARQRHDALDLFEPFKERFMEGATLPPPGKSSQQ